MYVLKWSKGITSLHKYFLKLDSKMKEYRIFLCILCTNESNSGTFMKLALAGVTFEEEGSLNVVGSTVAVGTLNLRHGCWSNIAIFNAIFYLFEI